MPEPIRIRIAEVIFESDCGAPANVSASPGPYRVEDTVSISKEAYEKFQEYIRQNNQLIGSRDEQQEKSPQDPELKRNLEALELDMGAKPEEIRKAYLNAIKKYHPDKNLNLPSELAKAAEEKTKQINSAYGTLRKA